MSTISSADAADRAHLVDLASRGHGGAVVYANDELFAERENLVKPETPQFQPYHFGHKGQIYDGWETRRRRESGVDYAVIRLGLPGAVQQLVVDTAHFKGNYPPAVSVQGCAMAGYPSPEELEQAEWSELLAESGVDGDKANEFIVDDDRRFTHLRLCMHPDGGIARLRAYGRPLADPRWLAGEFDLAALEAGGAVSGCSNMFFSSPANLLAPGEARVMGEGWETSRRRDDGNDWVTVRLAAPGVVRRAVLDTSHFKGNAPGWATLSGRRAGTDTWIELLGTTRLQPDAEHRFVLSAEHVVEEVRLDAIPDGGMARLRLYGEASAAGRDSLVLRWFNALPSGYAHDVLTAAGATPGQAADLVGRRPLSQAAELPAALGR